MSTITRRRLDVAHTPELTSWYAGSADVCEYGYDSEADSDDDCASDSD